MKNMKALILKNIFNEGPGTILNYFRSAGIAYTVLDLASESPPPPDRFDILIVMGGPMSVHDADRFPYLSVEEKIIQEAIDKDKKILGICLGAQMIAKAIGSRVYTGHKKEIGWSDITLTQDGLTDKAIGPLGKSFKVFQWHGDTFDIPKGAVRLAESALYPNQAFRFKDNIYALQFHLEVDEGIISDWLKDEELKGKRIEDDTRLYIDDYYKRALVFYEGIFGKPGM